MKEATQRTRRDLPGSSISNNILCIPMEPPVFSRFVLLLYTLWEPKIFDNCTALKLSENFSDAKSGWKFLIFLEVITDVPK